jgi:hypothetical protein
MEAAVLSRASFDLDCPTEQLRVQGLGGRSYGAAGCGARATYVLEGMCATEGNCTAVLNSPATVAPAGETPRPAASASCGATLKAGAAYRDWHRGPTLAFNGQIVVKQVYQCPRGTCFLAEMTFENWSPETNTATGYWSGSHIEFRRYIDSSGITQFWRGECSARSVKGTWLHETNPADHGVFEIFQ